MFSCTTICLLHITIVLAIILFNKLVTASFLLIPTKSPIISREDQGHKESGKPVDHIVVYLKYPSGGTALHVCNVATFQS